MKIFSSRQLIVAASGIALLMLAGLFFFQGGRRQNAEKNTWGTEQYGIFIQQLHRNVDSVQKKMERNKVVTPAIVPAVSRDPVYGQEPVPAIMDKDRMFVLQGISWSEDNPLVMIDNKLYKSGDRIGGYTIQQILSQTVILKDADGVRREIKFIKEARP